MRFDELPTWFQDLPREEQRLIRELGTRKRETVTNRIVPLDHGQSFNEHLLAAKARFLAQKEPFSMIRLGDFELGLLGAGYFPFNKEPNFSVMHGRAGYGRGAFHLRAPFIRAVRESELVGVLENWPSQRIETAVLLSMLDLETPLDRAVEVHLPYRLLIDGTLFSWLSGRKVLLIGNLAPKLSEAWPNASFQAGYAHFGLTDKVKIVGAIPMRSREEGGAWQDYERALNLSVSFDYDVALVSCGTTAKPLAHQLSLMGRTALDVGFVFDALAGERVDARKRRPVLGEAMFPDPCW